MEGIYAPLGTAFVLFLVALAVFFAVRSILRERRHGSGCAFCTGKNCGGCCRNPPGKEDSKGERD